MIVRGLHFSNPESHSNSPIGVVSGSELKGEFYIVNVGGTPAYIRQAMWEILTVGKLPMKRPNEGRGNTLQDDLTLQPGESTGLPFEKGTGGPLTDADLQTFYKGHMRVFLVGQIGYVDDLGIYRITGFAREYSTETTDRFVTVDNSDYEFIE